MVVSIKLTKREKEIVDAYTKTKGISLDVAMKEAFFEKIEEEYDSLQADAAIKEYEKNHKTYSIKEIMDELGL